jgi:hypothetical protein
MVSSGVDQVSSMGTGVRSPGVKRLRRDANHHDMVLSIALTFIHIHLMALYQLQKLCGAESGMRIVRSEGCGARMAQSV